MGAAEICVMQKEDLKGFVKELFLDKYSDRELSAPAAAQVLGISMATLNRWVDYNLIIPTNKALGGARVERHFNLAYLLTIDIKTLKSQYRQLNK